MADPARTHLSLVSPSFKSIYQLWKCPFHVKFFSINTFLILNAIPNSLIRNRAIVSFLSLSQGIGHFSLVPLYQAEEHQRLQIFMFWIEVDSFGGLALKNDFLESYGSVSSVLELCCSWQQVRQSGGLKLLWRETHHCFHLITQVEKWRARRLLQL